MASTNAEKKEIKEDYYNLIILATGREAAVESLGLGNIGFKEEDRKRKIKVDKNDRTLCHTVYAIGDVQEGRMELTPVAIKSGQLLVQRLFGVGSLMDYNLVPTTVFTPLEYGCCGLSEEEAKKVYGEENIECYHRQSQPLEWVLPKKEPRAYAKLICVKGSPETVVGFHFLGPNAGEVTQGFALALKLKATKTDFDQLVGIHPTCAEVFTSLDTTRSKQPDPSASQKDC